MVNINANSFNALTETRDGSVLYNINDVYIGKSLEIYGEYSRGECDIFAQLIHSEAIVVEIGANIGAHTLALAHMARRGVVHAFEPQRLVFQTLCANLALNSLTNVIAHQQAVGARADTLLVPVFDPNQRTNFGGIALDGFEQGEPVPMITLDSMALECVDFLKLDIEGMECDALAGAASTIERCRPAIYVEADRADKFAQLHAILSAHGYAMYWSIVPMFRADNFRGVTEDIFGNVVSSNLLCLPAEKNVIVTDMRLVSGPDDCWNAGG